MENLLEHRNHIPRKLIYLSFIVAIFVDLIPISHPSFHWIPDVMALLIIYWLIHTPKEFNLGTVFILGLISDTATGSPLGQHALTYTISGFIILTHQKHIVGYNYGWQSLVVLAILLLNHIIMFLIRLIINGKIAHWSYFLPPFIGALLWPLLNKILFIAFKPRRRRE